MAKLELFKRIQKLATIVHGGVESFDLSDDCIMELRRTLDTLTEEYIDRYCETSY